MPCWIAGWTASSSADGWTTLRWRLSLLMFLQYAPAAALVSQFTLRLQDLGFTPGQIAWVCTTQALSSLIGPIVAGQVADRWWPAQRCVAVCGLSAGVFLWVLADQTYPWAVFALSLASWLFLTPAITLGAALTFTHLAAPERNFGRVRLWGTIGWIVPGWLIGYWLGNPAWLSSILSLLRPETPRSGLADAFRLASLCAVALGFYALTLPHTPPRRHLGSPLAPLAALRLLRDRSFAVCCFGNFAVCITTAFSSQGTQLLLNQLGVALPWNGPTQTLAQSTEVLTLALLPILLLRLGIRGTMTLGLVCWGLGLTAFSLGRPLWLVVAMLGTWGLVICCYLVTGQMFINSRARGDIRASVQGLFTFTNGLGLLAGNLLAGWIRMQSGGALEPMYAVAAGIIAVLVVVFLIGFTESGKLTPASEAPSSFPQAAAHGRITSVS